jgi:hypothetical protein
VLLLLLHLVDSLVALTVASQVQVVLRGVSLVQG